MGDELWYENGCQAEPTITLSLAPELFAQLAFLGEIERVLPVRIIARRFGILGAIHHLAHHQARTSGNFRLRFPCWLKDLHRRLKVDVPERCIGVDCLLGDEV